MKSFFSDVFLQFTDYYDRLVALFPKLMIGVMVLILFIFLGRWMNKILLRILDTKSDDPILTSFLASAVKMIFILMGFLFFLQLAGFGKLVTSLMATAGVSAFIIGFAFKDLGENFLAGVMMAFNRPFKLGDIIEVSKFKGKIIKLSFRDTQIKTSDGIDVYIPNSILLKNPLKNYTIDGYIRDEFDLKLRNESNIELAIKLMHETMQQTPGILYEERKPSVGISGVSGSNFILHITYWRNAFAEKIPGYRARTDVIKECTSRLKAEGIELV